MPADVLLAAHPVDIYRALNEVFGDVPWSGWEPETLLASLPGEVPDLVRDKVLAVQALAANPLPALTEALALEKTVHALCNNICVMDVRQPLYVEELAYGVGQMLAILADVTGKRPEAGKVFRGETPGYVAATARFRDWFVLPPPLEFAQRALDGLTGLEEGSARGREHARLVKAVSDLCRHMTAKDAAALLRSPDIRQLEAHDAESLLVRRVMGAMLFDPTLPYIVAA